MKFVSVLAMLLLASCASDDRSKYGPAQGFGGYKDETLKNSMQVASFSGNAYTHASDAEVFAVARAFEVCLSQNELPRIFDVLNSTTSKDVQRSSGYATYNPGRYNNGYFTSGSGYSSGSSWTETWTYPAFEVYYVCLPKVGSSGVQVKTVDGDTVKSYVSDTMGATLITEVDFDGPNSKTLKAGDIVIKINDERIKSKVEYMIQIDTAQLAGGHPVKATIIRDFKRMDVKVNVVDGSARVIGMKEEILGKVCDVPEVKTRPMCTDRSPASKPFDPDKYLESKNLK